MFLQTAKDWYDVICVSLLRVGEMHSRRFENLGLLFNRLELTLDLKVSVSLAVHLRVALLIGL